VTIILVRELGKESNYLEIVLEKQYISSKIYYLAYLLTTDLTDLSLLMIQIPE